MSLSISEVEAPTLNVFAPITNESKESNGGSVGMGMGKLSTCFDGSEGVNGCQHDKSLWLAFGVTGHKFEIHLSRYDKK